MTGNGGMSLSGTIYGAGAEIDVTGNGEIIDLDLLSTNLIMQPERFFLNFSTAILNMPARGPALWLAYDRE